MPQLGIKDASNGLHPHKYNPLTVASLDFAELLCTRFIECEKSDKWNSVKAKGHLRLAALDFPAYGRSYIKSAAFFVPYYQLLQNYDGLRSDMIVDKGQPCVVPYIPYDSINKVISNHLTTNGWCSIVWEGITLSGVPSSDTYDMMVVSDNGSGVTKWHAVNLDYRGKRFYKWMKSLGFDKANPSAATTLSNQPDYHASAMNILAYCKVWCDYFLNIHLYNSHWMVAFLRAVKDGNNYVNSGGNTWYNASTGEISLDCLENIFSSILLPFESNMYLNAWNATNSPAGLNNVSNVHPVNFLSPYIPTDQLNVGTTLTNHNLVYSDLNSVYLRDTDSSDGSYSLVTLSQLGLNALGAVWDFIRRNNLVGSNAAIQALARFGIKGEDFNSFFARKLFEDSQQIDFSAVMSNSNTVSGTNGSVLGAYAGIGLGSMNFDYQYECSDYGIILNLNWIQFNALQLNGFDPSVFRFSAFDWYSPKWDGKALRGIPMMEVCAGKTPSNYAQNNGDGNIFGFVGLYDEYRNMRDVVLGDFCCGFAKNFLFARDLGYKRDNAVSHLSPQTNSVQCFNRFGQDKSITDPFQFANTDGDRFYLQFVWEIDSMRPMLSDADALMLDGAGDVQINTDSSTVS